MGGRGGIAPSELGKVWSSLWRRSSNSEKRFRIQNDEPYSLLSAKSLSSSHPSNPKPQIKRKSTYTQRLNRNIPHDKSTNARPLLIHHYMIINVHALRPAEFVLGVLGAIFIVLQGDAAGDDGLDGYI